MLDNKTGMLMKKFLLLAFLLGTMINCAMADRCAHCNNAPVIRAGYKPHVKYILEYEGRELNESAASISAIDSSYGEFYFSTVKSILGKGIDTVASDHEIAGLWREISKAVWKKFKFTGSADDVLLSRSISDSCLNIKTAGIVFSDIIQYFDIIPVIYEFEHGVAIRAVRRHGNDLFLIVPEKAVSDSVPLSKEDFASFGLFESFDELPKSLGRNYSHFSLILPDVFTCKNIAEELIRKKNYANAQYLLEKTLVSASVNPQVLYRIAEVYMMQNKKGGALAHYKYACKAQPENIKFKTGFGNACLSIDSIALAKQQFEAALKLDKSNLQAKYGLARVSEREGRNSDAIKILGECINADPKFADAYYLRGTLFRKLNKKKEALSDLRLAVQLGNTSAAAEINSMQENK